MTLIFMNTWLACLPSPNLEGWTADKQYYVVTESDPSPIPFNEYFSLTVNVLDSLDGKPLNDVVSVMVDANMPAHEHGMNEIPSMTVLDDGRFNAEGLKWFMSGEWAIEVFVTNEEGLTDVATFLYECCES